MRNNTGLILKFVGTFGIVVGPVPGTAPVTPAAPASGTAVAVQANTGSCA